MNLEEKRNTNSWTNIFSFTDSRGNRSTRASASNRNDAPPIARQNFRLRQNSSPTTIASRVRERRDDGWYIDSRAGLLWKIARDSQIFLRNKKLNVRIRNGVQHVLLHNWFYIFIFFNSCFLFETFLSAAFEFIFRQLQVIEVFCIFAIHPLIIGLSRVESRSIAFENRRRAY